MMPPPALKTALRLLMTLALATGLSACASMPQKTPPPSNPAPTPVETPASTPETLTAQRAGQLTATGHDLAAAKDYIRAAAEARGQTQVHYLMEAAQASLKGRKPRVAILLANEVLRLQHDNAELRSAALWVRAQGF
ncbi:MAG: penicillin-binding protein activator, partial [Acidithiobacillus ferrivorans]